MIDAIHLLWIVPSCVIAGMAFVAIFALSSKTDNLVTAYHIGFMKGLKSSMDIDTSSCGTFGQWLTESFNDNYQRFMDATGGLIYGVDGYSQLYMIHISNADDISKYYCWEIVGFNSESHPIIKEKIK